VKLAGEHRFEIGRERLWRALVDPALLSRVLPGCEPLEPTGENAWKAAMTVKVGPVQGRFQGSLALPDLVAPQSYRMAIEGSGPAGFLRGSGGIDLRESEGGTLLAYALDAQVGGRVASVGQRLVESSGRALAKQGLEGLARELAAREAAAAGGAETPSEPPAPPSTAAFAGRFARGLWAELPASWRWGLGLAGVLLLVALALLVRGC